MHERHVRDKYLGSIQVIMSGTNFSNNSQVMLNPDFPPGNGQPNGQVLIPTTVQSSTQLTATIPASYLANFGSTNSVGVHTPPPGGGTTFSPPPTGTGTTPLPTFTVVAPAPPHSVMTSSTSLHLRRPPARARATAHRE